MTSRSHAAMAEEIVRLREKNLQLLAELKNILELFPDCECGDVECWRCSVQKVVDNAGLE